MKRSRSDDELDRTLAISLASEADQRAAYRLAVAEQQQEERSRAVAAPAAPAAPATAGPSSDAGPVRAGPADCSRDEHLALQLQHESEGESDESESDDGLPCGAGIGPGRALCEIKETAWYAPEQP